MADALQEITIFARVVNTGSLSAAARDLGLSPALVSRRLSGLEARLGVRLINRTLCDLLGWPSDDVTGRNVETLLTIPTRIFYQTHVFPTLKLQGVVHEIYMNLVAASGAKASRAAAGTSAVSRAQKVVGYLAAMIRGEVDYSKMEAAAWVGLPHFQTPEFHLGVVGLFVPVVLVLAPPTICNDLFRYAAFGRMVNGTPLNSTRLANGEAEAAMYMKIELGKS